MNSFGTDFWTKYKTFLEKNFDPVKAKKEKEYLYSDVKHHGIPTAIRINFLKQFNKDIEKMPKKDVLKMAKEAWDKKSYDEKMFGLHVMGLHQKELNLSDMPFIEKIMRESHGWVFLDCSIIPFMPGILEKYPSAYSYLKKWIKDKDFWVRRSALLAQLLFFRAGTSGDKKLFFELAKSQLDESWIDKEYKDNLMRSRARFFLRKAIGWTLREMSAKDPESVIKFLNENKEKLSGLSYREGSRKLPAKYKQMLK